MATYLAVPSQALESFGLQLVVELLRRSEFSTRHDCGCEVCDGRYLVVCLSLKEQKLSRRARLR